MVDIIEIKAGELNLNVPYTIEGMKVVRAMVNLLEAELTVRKTPTSGSGEAEVEPTQEPETPSPQQKKSTRIQRIKGWEPIGKSRIGIIYKEVVNRLLEVYKEGVEPENEIFSKVIREMYGEHLTKSSIATYISTYRVYIRENKLAVEPSAKGLKPNNLHIEDIGEPTVKLSQKRFMPKGKEILPMNKVVEVWELLPEEFEYKLVKSLVPVHIAQTTPRIDATNYIIKQFLDNPAFGCVETSPGVFLKKEISGE